MLQRLQPLSQKKNLKNLLNKESNAMYKVKQAGS